MVKRSIKGQKLPARKLQHVVLKLFIRRPSKRYNAKQIIKKLGIKNSKTSVEDTLSRLQEAGKIQHIKDDKFKLSKEFAPDMSGPAEVYDGVVDQIRSGAAYIIIEGKEGEDIYVPAKKLKQAMDGDLVRVEVLRRYGKKIEGQVIKVLKRSTEQFIGDLRQSKNIAFVIPDNRMADFDIFIHPRDLGIAQDGDKVLVRISEWPDRAGKNPRGQIIKVLDATDTHGVMMDSILINHGFDTLFSNVVMQEAKKLPRMIDPEEIANRLDLRQVPTITIDPATARDFDDALSYRELENGRIEIGVHIADVTHYVRPGTALDREALRRSTSVYLVDRVAPMLPEVLSNELCSLRPDEDSLTFSAIFEFDRKNKIVKRWFGKSIIHSIKRFSYEEAQATLDEGEGEFFDMLTALNRIAKLLRKRRYKQGSIAFETPELEFELDENNHPIAIHTKIRKDTHLLVEDLMLLANREVATYIAKKSDREIPFVYRIHDQPDEERLAEYSLFLKELGFNFDIQSPAQIRNSFNRLSEAAKSDEVLAFAEPFAVRTMAKAVYSSYNIGHFGLGFEYYTHFTSPIRRYADVLVHRLLEKNLKGTFRTSKEELEAQCKHISNQEKKAQEAERDSIKFKQVEFISGHVGEIFHGIISGMIDRGFFVTLKESGVDGLVQFADLLEPFSVSDNRMKAKSKRSDRSFKIGDQVKVLINSVNINDMEVDMELVE
ncbi:MAG: ribonuclease R [Saprospiraceae bacterium]|nr:ribonuclease R [Saprospiraceae bacterium]